MTQPSSLFSQLAQGGKTVGGGKKAGGKIDRLTKGDKYDKPRSPQGGKKPQPRALLPSASVFIVPRRSRAIQSHALTKCGAICFSHSLSRVNR